jgi:hypothetical protein
MTTHLFKEKYPGKSNPDLKGNVYDGLQKMRDARISSSLCQCLYSDSACSENLV